MHRVVEPFVLDLEALKDLLRLLDVDHHRQLENLTSALQVHVEKLTDNRTVHHRADLESIRMDMEVHHHREDRANGVMAQVQDHLILALNEVTGKVLCLMDHLVARTCLMAIQLGALHLTSLMVILSIHLATIHPLTDGLHNMIQGMAENLQKVEESVQEATRLLRIVREMTPWHGNFILHLMIRMMYQMLLDPVHHLSDQGNITFNTRLEELHPRVASTRVISRSDLHRQVVRILS
mmetsp:Transcript_9476/g.22333  ORF Transcript_9476/g.22333 Transcript_9476/m.22333 type:complete len:237 (+) Transcript_9476:1324-2034(+)